MLKSNVLPILKDSLLIDYKYVLKNLFTSSNIIQVNNVELLFKAYLHKHKNELNKKDVEDITLDFYNLVNKKTKIIFNN